MQLYIQAFREILLVGVEILGCKKPTFSVFWGERLTRVIDSPVSYVTLKRASSYSE
jgi:hypothetical protein